MNIGRQALRKERFLIILLAAGLFIFTPDALADWSAAQRLTRTSGDSSFPAVAIDSVNTVHVVWHDATPGNMAIYYKRSEDGGATWSAAQRLTWTSGEAYFPAMAIASSNTIHLVWADSTPGNSEIYYKKSSDGGTTWSSVKRLTWTSGNSSFPAIAIDSDDNLDIVWSDLTPGTNQIYHKRSADGGTTWSAAQRITWSSSSSENPDIAIDSANALHVVWSQYIVANPEIFYKTSSDGGSTWSAAQRLTWASGSSSRPAIAVDSSDALHVAWSDDVPGNPEVYYRTSSDGGTTWNPVKRLTWTSSNSYVPAIAIDSANIIFVVWYDDAPGNYEIYYRLSKDGGTVWSTINRLTWTSGTSTLPAIAFDSGGTAHVVWNDDTPGNKEIYYKNGN